MCSVQPSLSALGAQNAHSVGMGCEADIIEQRVKEMATMLTWAWIRQGRVDVAHEISSLSRSFVPRLS